MSCQWRAKSSQEVKLKEINKKSFTYQMLTAKLTQVNPTFFFLFFSFAYGQYREFNLRWTSPRRPLACERCVFKQRAVLSQDRCGWGFIYPAQGGGYILVFQARAWHATLSGFKRTYSLARASPWCRITTDSTRRETRRGGASGVSLPHNISPGTFMTTWTTT